MTNGKLLLTIDQVNRLGIAGPGMPAALMFISAKRV
jgi:hypothetical protein